MKGFGSRGRPDLASPGWRRGVVDGLCPTSVTRCIGYDGSTWPHLSVVVFGWSGSPVTEVRRARVSRVQQLEAIRRDHRVEGLSVRGLADKHGVHRPRCAKRGRQRCRLRARPPRGQRLGWVRSRQRGPGLGGRADAVGADTALSLAPLVDRYAQGVRRTWWPAEGAAPGQRLGDGFSSTATVLENKTGMVYIAPGCLGSWLHRLVQQPTAQGVSPPQPLEHLVGGRVLIGDFKHDHNHRHCHSVLGSRTPADYAAAHWCSHTPVTCSDLLRTDQTKPDSRTGSTQ